MEIETIYMFLMMIAALVFVLGSICKACGLTWFKIKKFTIWFISLFNKTKKLEKQNEKIEKRVRKYGEKKGLEQVQVEDMLRNLISQKEAEIAKKAELKEAAKREKELERLIR